MEGTQTQDWTHSTDVLQGIMVHHDAKASFEGNLDLQLGSLDPSNSFLNQWCEDSYYSYSRSGDQDAWNPLLVTGVPPSSISQMNRPAPDQDCCYSQHHYSEPSENGSQYVDNYHSADSGYGGTSCATQSVVASNYGVETSPHKDVSDATFDPHFGSGSSYTSEFVGSPSMIDGSVRCDHPSCSWVGKCPSDKRKHEARHRKLFKCDEPNCPRKEGFGTINDLARHKKCVHNKEPERGPKMMYMCFGTNCPRPNKRWPRLDNFKQHLNRMHHEEDGCLLLKRSMDWYEKVTGRPGQNFDDRTLRDEWVLEAHDDMASVRSTTEVEPEMNTMPQQQSDLFKFGTVPLIPEYGTSISPEASQYPPFGSLGLTGQESATDRNTKLEGSITDAADNLINAMTKMVNNRGRKSTRAFDEGIDLDSDAQLSQPQRQMLQKVLSVALERLSDGTESTRDTSDKQGWFQCDACPKQTRLRCEMKKHQKRHDRPYGCTFPHCAKTFGSKADWKRHESSQHLGVPSWLCTAHDPRQGTDCGRLFDRPELYTQHLRQHGMQEYQVVASVTNNRLDLAGQSDFWCGFCNCRVPLRSHGHSALDERFNHIDVEHFKKGERGQDWSSPLLEMNEDLDGRKTRKRKLAV